MKPGACLLLLGLVLASCGQASHRVSVLWTNVPETALAVELFNASQREWQVLLEYKDDPAALLSVSGPRPDLVVARGLASTAVKDGLAPLDFLFEGGTLATASFYRHSLDAGQQGDRYKLLPASIDLAVLLLPAAGSAGLPAFALSPDDLRQAARGFDTGPVARVPRRLAFSPRWEGFGLLLLQGHGQPWREGFAGDLSWDGAALQQGLQDLASWPLPGPDAVQDFTRKYLQSDWALPLVSGRIQFYPLSLTAFISRPFDERRGVDFRYFDVGGRLATLDGTVWAGVPSAAQARGAADRFLRWFYLESTQAELIRRGRAADDRGFGVLGGLSALPAANEAALVSTWPELAGRLPGADQLRFWPSLPLAWPRLKAAVLKPWLDGPEPTEAGLRAALEKFRTQSGR